MFWVEAATKPLPLTNSTREGILNKATFSDFIPDENDGSLFV